LFIDEIKEFEQYRKERNERLKAQKQQHHNEEAGVAAASMRKDEEQQQQQQSTGKHYKYVIVGGGTAAMSALLELKKNDPSAEVLLVTEENFAPYKRPPLSKELFRSKDGAQSLKYKDWQGKDDTLEYKSEDWYKQNKVTIKKGTSVTNMNIQDQTISTNGGETYRYDKCLLATGGYPRIIPGDYEQLKGSVTEFRTIEDFRKLDSIAKQGGQVVIVGGSFLGSELAYSLAAHRNCKVTQVFLEPEVMARNLPRYLGGQVKDTLQRAGVQLKPNRNVIAVDKQGNTVQIKFDNGEQMQADHVLLCIGIFPNTELAERSGLEIDPVNGGIMTNSELEARNNVFVAGDVLSYHDPVLGRRRVEHYEHAASTGACAGRNMSSTNNKRASYDHISMFWSEIGNISFEAVGEVNSRLNTFSVWDGVDIVQNGTPWSIAPAPLQNRRFKRGIVYYMNNNNRVVGVLLWNVPGKINAARAVVAAKKEYRDLNDLSDEIKM